MNTPPFLLGATLLFWGWQTGLWVIGLVLGLILEASSRLQVRWEFSAADFRRIWTLCTLLFLGATVYAFVAHDGTSGLTSLFDNQSMARRSESLIKTSHSVLSLLQWMPVIFFPMVAAQVYSNAPGVDLRALSWIMRRRRIDPWGTVTLNLCYPFLVICLLATSTTNSQETSFFAGLCILLAWALWAGRNHRFSKLTWIGSLVIAVGMGFFGHLALNHLQKVLQNLDISLIARLGRNDATAGGSRTALGTVGRLKLSGQIMLRVTPETEPAPALLREATYNLFKSPLWYGAQKEFVALVVENDESTWQIGDGHNTNSSVVISRFMREGRGLLTVPHGVNRVEQLPFSTLKSNALSVLRVDSGVGFVNYRARYGSLSETNDSFEDDDLEIPRNERAALETVAAELKLEGLAPEEILRRIQSFFPIASVTPLT